VAFGHGLGQVLGGVADELVRLGGTAEHTAGVDLDPELHDMLGFAIRVRVQRVV
jgi:hypothetical protein